MQICTIKKAEESIERNVISVWSIINTYGIRVNSMSLVLIVMNIAQVASICSGMPSNKHVMAPALMLRWIVRICWATTDRTSASMRLNSFRHTLNENDANQSMILAESKLFKTSPGAACRKSFEEFAQRQVIQAIRTVEYNNLFGHGFGQFFDGFRFAHTGRSLQANMIMIIELRNFRIIAGVVQIAVN